MRTQLAATIVLAQRGVVPDFRMDQQTIAIIERWCARFLGLGFSTP
jgi:hypothetical protein